MPPDIIYPNLRPRKAFWGHRKKERSIGMTDAAWQGLEEVAKELGLSRSEVVQQIGLRLLTVSKAKADLTAP